MAAAQVRITGAVVERSGSASPTPLAEAYVLAKNGSPERVIAEAVTDSRGRYALTGLPTGRISLSVQAQGYYTAKAGDLETDSITRSCPQNGDCGETNFELARAAVIEGWLTDAYGDPVQDIQVELTPESAAQQTDRSARRAMSAGQSISDDRGYFRIWGVKPGRYELATQPSNPPFAGGPRAAPQKQIIEIADGQTRYEARLSVKGESELYSISGEITGIPPEKSQRIGLEIHPAGDADNLGWTRFEQAREGKFSVSGLRKGRYILNLVDFNGGERQSAYLETVTIDRDLTGLKLSPKAPSGIRGRVEFVEAPAANQAVSLRRPGERGYSAYALRVNAPDYAFEDTGLAPGEYEPTLAGSGDYYLVERPSITVVPGEVQEIVLRVSNQRATVRGTARMSSGADRQAAAHFTIALRGDRGSHKIQADDSGGFVFEKVIPGEYRIAAWQALDINIQDDEVWRRAGGNVKQLILEPGFETEIDLTVTP